MKDPLPSQAATLTGMLEHLVGQLSSLPPVTTSVREESLVVSVTNVPQVVTEVGLIVNKMFGTD